MKYRKAIKQIIISSLIFPSLTQAAIISTDWQSVGDNLITRDTSSNLDWLDLTVTNNLEYYDVYAQLSSGGMFEGWRFAYSHEVEALWSNLGVDLNTSISETSINSLDPFVQEAAILLGNTSCELNCSDYPYGTFGYTGTLLYSTIYGDLSLTMGAYQYMQESTTYSTTYESTHTARIDTGSYLVRASVVPIPAAVWLFGSGLISLVGFARRKKS